MTSLKDDMGLGEWGVESEISRRLQIRIEDFPDEVK